ncbi:MAG: polysaccharide deacetylase family protein [Phycisphaerales bacterium]|nr:polysaccharide deacetylase family protein [Phycisphaerales bacterium]
MYHRVLPAGQAREYPLASLAMPVHAFEEQVAWLAGRYHVVSLRDAAEMLHRGEAPEKRVIALTFDDGYADNFENVGPILERYGLRGTFFVTTGFVEGSEPMWFDIAAEAWLRGSPSAREGMVASLPKPPDRRVAREGGIRVWMQGLKQVRPGERLALIDRATKLAPGGADPAKYRAMTREQVAELHARGHEIGSHTITHPILTQLDDGELLRELVESKDTLESWIGDEVSSFCYPNGDWDERVKAAALEAGYRVACTTTPGFNRRQTDRLLLSRFDITPQRVLNADGTHDLLGFRAEVCGWRHLCRRLMFR